MGLGDGGAVLVQEYAMYTWTSIETNLHSILRAVCQETILMGLRSGTSSASALSGAIGYLAQSLRLLGHAFRIVLDESSLIPRRASDERAHA